MMAIDPHYIELMNAEIDGGIAPQDQTMLDEYLAENAEAAAYRDELGSMCEELDAMPLLATPSDLHQHILTLISTETKRPEPASRSPMRMLRNLIAIQPLRYAATFAAGIVVTVTLVSSERADRHAFDDVTSLVGTMAGAPAADTLSTQDDMQLTLNELAGSVSLLSAGTLLILDFDLASRRAVEIVAAFDDRDVWFNGFAQLESTGTTVAAETGQVRVRMDGQRRYAVYLHNTGTDSGTVELQFYAGGQLLHEGKLRFGTY